MFYTYLIWCDSEVYVGFTSRPPRVRWDEHKESAANGSNTKFHRTLRERGITKTAMQRYDNEIDALVGEIRLIEIFKTLDKSLNSTKGGEGNNFKVRIVDSEVIATPVSEKVKQQRRAYYKRRQTKRRQTKRRRFRR